MVKLGKMIGGLKMNEEWDKLLNIKTTGRDDSRADTYNYPYEPTPYSVLKRIADSEEITKDSVLLDYGCGKGRAVLFFSWQLRCRSIGIEYDERLYDAAFRNKERSVSGRLVSLKCADACEYKVPIEVDRCFFFNPFSVEILRKAVSRIIESYYEDPREIMLFFYYPSDEYMAYLMTVEELSFYDEIDCRDLFPGDSREQVVIFTT